MIKRYKVGSFITVKCLRDTEYRDKLTIGKLYRVEISYTGNNGHWAYFKADNGIVYNWYLPGMWFKILPEDDLEPAMS